MIDQHGQPHDTIDIPISTEDADHLFAWRVQDDSMSLEAADGSIIVIDADQQMLEDNRLYAVKLGKSKSVFRRYRDTDGPPRLEPSSHDPRHTTIFIEHPIKVLGRVIMIVRET